MTPKDVLHILALAEPVLIKHGIIDATTGQFVSNAPLVEAENIALVAQDVEAALVAEGVVVPAQLDKIIHVLPSILPLIGVIAGQ